MRSATGFHSCRLAVRGVLNVIVTHYATEAFVFGLVVGAAGQGRLERAVGPVGRVCGRVTVGTAEVVEVAAVGLGDSH